MSVVNPYTQQELEERGWAFQTEDIGRDHKTFTFKDWIADGTYTADAFLEATGVSYADLRAASIGDVVVDGGFSDTDQDRMALIGVSILDGDTVHFMFARPEGDTDDVRCTIYVFNDKTLTITIKSAYFLLDVDGVITSRLIETGAVTKSKLSVEVADGLTSVFDFKTILQPSGGASDEVVSAAEWESYVGKPVSIIADIFNAGSAVIHTPIDSGTNGTVFPVFHTIKRSSGLISASIIMLNDEAAGGAVTVLIYEYTPNLPNQIVIHKRVYRSLYGYYVNLGGTLSERGMYEALRTILDSPISSDKIADEAVTREKLSTEIQKLLGTLSELVASGYVIDPTIQSYSVSSAKPYGRIGFYTYASSGIIQISLLKIEANTTSATMVTQWSTVNAIGQMSLQSDSVNTSKILDTSVTLPKLSNDIKTSLTALSAILSDGYVYDKTITSSSTVTAKPYGRFYIAVDLASNVYYITIGVVETNDTIRNDVSHFYAPNTSYVWGSANIQDKSVTESKLSADVQKKLNAGANSVRYDESQELTAEQRVQAIAKFK